MLFSVKRLVYNVCFGRVNITAPCPWSMQLPVLGLDAEYINKRISAISVNLRQKRFILPKVYLFF